jgi:ribonuclease HI
MRYVVYADGACIGNPGPGGWGVVVVEPPQARREMSGGPFPATTNNRMELMAAIEALRALKPGAEVILRSDSTYLVNTMNRGWKRNANHELWHELDREVSARPRVDFQWVAGHAGDPWNERADRLAQAAARGRASAGPKAARCAKRDAPDEEDAARELAGSLSEGESIRRCAGCGRLFLSRSAGQSYCSLVQCELSARRRKD